MDFKELKLLLKLKFSRSKISEFNRLDSPWYYFMHIPKTAGTTFRYTLYEAFSAELIYPNYRELSETIKYLKWSDLKPRIDTVFPRHKMFFIGHYGYTPISYFKNNKPQVLTFLRQPHRRVMSTIIFQQRPGRIYENMTISEIMDKELSRMAIAQARSFGYKPGKNEDVNRLFRRMEQIEFIGISEQFERSVALCNATFGWDLKVMKSRNVGRYKPSIFSEEQLARINKASEVDQQVYAYGLQLFEERCAKHGI